MFNQRNRSIFIIFLLSLSILFIFNYHLPTQEIPVKLFEKSNTYLHLYEQQLSLLKATPFLPKFHNHRLSLKINLTSLSREYFSNFSHNSSVNVFHFNITCAQKSQIPRLICNVSLTFYFNYSTQLHVISNRTTCSLSILRIDSDIILINLHELFPSHFQFYFQQLWSHQTHQTVIAWPQWPPSNERPNQNTLIHYSSQDLFVHEQNSLSKWLDLWTTEQRKLVPFERAKNFSVCSKQFQNWIFDYQQWHKNITTVLLFNQKSKTNDEQRHEIVKHDIRFLIYEKQLTGIADRFIHLISTYFVALLTKRLFIFDEDWPDFHEIFQLSLNSDYQSFVPLFEKFTFSRKVQSFSFDRYLKDYDYDEQFPERVLIFKGHTGGVIQTIDSNTSVYRKFLTEDLQMNANNIFGCLYHSLFTYKLSEVVQRVPLSNTKLNSFDHSSHEILQILLSPRFFTIGVQIRAGDATMQQKSTNQLLNDTRENSLLGRIGNYLNCTLDLIHQNQQSKVIPVVFLMSDSYEIRRSALKRWSLSLQSQSQLKNNRLYILSDSKPVLHIQYTNNRLFALQLGVFHMFLFSLCERHLISTDSGFGRIPAFASLRQRNIYSLSLNERTSCRNQGITLIRAGRNWSGI